MTMTAVHAMNPAEAEAAALQVLQGWTNGSESFDHYWATVFANSVSASVKRGTPLLDCLAGLLMIYRFALAILQRVSESRNRNN